MATVGYFEGTSSDILTRLAVRGINTLPLSNGVDGHGKYAYHISKGEVDVVVAYVHKLLPAPGIQTSPKDILFACGANKIPVLFVVPEEARGKAKEILGDTVELGKIVSPENLFDEIAKILG